MKPLLGNLFEHNYESEEFNNERNKLYKLREEYDSDLLCRKCKFSLKK